MPTVTNYDESLQTLKGLGLAILNCAVDRNWAAFAVGTKLGTDTTVNRFTARRPGTVEASAKARVFGA
jgi:hypothetical protein